MAENKVRIIAGQWRGSKLRFADIDGLRPSGDRVREVLFNWLSPHIHGACCLDLYAGSGCLGFEALSRGAEAVLALDAHSRVIATLKEEKQRIGANALTIQQADALRWLNTANPESVGAPFDIVFVDPPFASDLFERTIEAVEKAAERGMLAQDTLIYLETAKSTVSPSIPQTWQLIKQKNAGSVSVALYRR